MRFTAITLSALLATFTFIQAINPSQVMAKNDSNVKVKKNSGTKITWYGHAAFKIMTPSGKVILIDPWITNPANKNGKADLESMNKADLILVTHGHFDHIGDSIQIAGKTKAKLVSTFDLGSAIVQAGYPKDLVGYDTQGNFGGSLDLLNGEVKITFIPAVHSSGLSIPDKGDIYGGNPGGFLISIKNGPSIYHTGDTDLFSDMSLISKFAKVTVMLSTIGDHFTMGPDRAAEAVKMVNPAWVVPMHFGTFPILTGTTEVFSKELTKRGLHKKLKIMKVHEELAL